MAGDSWGDLIRKHSGGGGRQPRLGGGGGHKQRASPSWDDLIAFHSQKGLKTGASRKPGAPSLTRQVLDPVENFPSGAAHFAVGTATDPVASTLTGGAIGTAIEPGIGTLVGGAIGLGAGLLGFGARKAVNPKADPLEMSKEMLHSGERTVGRLAHPSRYAKAVKHGQIVGSVLEDLANISLVASAGAGGVSAATGGAAKGAATAGVAAREGEELAASAGSRAAELGKQLAQPGLTSAAYKAKGKLFLEHSQAANRGQAAGRAGRAVEATKTAQAGGKGVVGAYRVLHGVGSMGNRGAMLPAEPFKLAGKGVKVAAHWAQKDLSPRLATFIEKAPAGQALNESLTKFADLVGTKARTVSSQFFDRTGLGNLLHHEDVQGQERQARITESLAKIDAQIPDKTEQNAFYASLAKIPEALAPLKELHPDEAHEIISELIDEEGPLRHLTPEGLELATKVASGKADPELVARFNEAQRIYEEEVLHPMQELQLAAHGHPDTSNLTEEQRNHLLWQFGSDQPNPLAMRDMQAHMDRVYEAYRGIRDTAEERLNKELGGRRVTPEQLRSLSGAMRHDTQAALDTATEFISDESGGGRQWTEQLIEKASNGRKQPASMTDAELTRELADLIEISRRHGVSADEGVLGQLVDMTQWSGPAIGGPLLSSLQGAMKQGRIEGRAASYKEVATSLREREAKLRERGAHGEADVLHTIATPKQIRQIRRVYRQSERVKKAEAEYADARQRAAAAGEEATAAELPKARLKLRRAIEAERREIRGALKEAADSLERELEDVGWPSKVGKRDTGGSGAKDALNRIHREVGTWFHSTTSSRTNGLPWDEVAANIESRHPGVSAEGQVGRTALDWWIDQATELRDLRDAAKGMQSRGLPHGTDLARIMSRAGFDLDPESIARYEKWHVGDRPGGGSTGDLSPAEAVARAEKAGDLERPEAFPPESKQRVMEAVQAAQQREQETGTFERPTGLAPHEQVAFDSITALLRKEGERGQLASMSQQTLNDLGERVFSQGEKPSRTISPGAALEREARRATGKAGSAEARALKAQPHNLARAMAETGGGGAKVGLKIGRQEERIAQAARDLGIAERRLAKFPEMQQRMLEKAANDIRNAPARFKPYLMTGQAATKIVERKAAEADALAPGAGQELRNVVVEINQNLAQAVSGGPHLAGPGGELIPTREPVDPTFVIGGDVRKMLGKGEGGQKGTLTKNRKPGNLKQRETIAQPADVREHAMLVNRRLHEWTQVEAAKQVGATYGVSAAQVLGTPLEELGVKADSPTVHKELADLGYRLERTDTGLIAMPAKLRGKDALAAAMEEQGYVPWDPQAFMPSMKKAKAQAQYMPKHLYDAFKGRMEGPGRVELAFRKYYDKPMAAWKASVLALSPRWQVNNVVGNAIMSMAGGGMNPVEWGARMIETHKILSDIKKGDFRRLDELGLEYLPPRLHAGSAGAALRDLGGLGEDYMPGKGGRFGTPIKSKVGRTVEWSYNLNGTFDDMNRIANFLHQRERLTDAQVMAHVRKSPELAGLSGDALKNEVAVRLAVKVSGDFTRLSPFERQFAKRVMPFYPWVRHITKLALSLPITSPARIVWILHLSQMLGEPAEFGFLENSIPLGENKGELRLVHMPKYNPFSDLAGYGSSGQASSIPASFLGNLSPALSIGDALVTGQDLRRGLPLSRPPGSGNTGDRGEDVATPLLGKPGEAAYVLSQLFPQARLAQAARDQITRGNQPVRYQTGEIMKVGGAPLIKKGAPRIAPLLDLIGSPYRENVNVAQLRGIRDTRLNRAESSRRRYASSTSQAATSSSLTSYLKPSKKKKRRR